MLDTRSVRFALVLLSACQLAPSGADTLHNGSGSGSGSAAPGECAIDTDCALAATTCCACPTFAVSVTDPAHAACADMQCPPSSCTNNVRATCELGACTIACVALACPAQSCASGFAVDATGCLSCACDAGATECTIDSDCARVPADCCGCTRGGRDTAVPNSLVAQHDAALGCPAQPQCPGVDTCAPDLAPRCVRGSCELVSGTGALPPNACGRADLPACPTGMVCTVNSDAVATMQGVGVCLPD
jgi:hypothetical protein